MVRWIRNITIGTLVLIMAGIIIEVIYFLYIDYRFAVETEPFGLDPTPTVWAHMGNHEASSPNSLAAFKNAYLKGAKGVEMDVHFDRKLNRFVVSHDFPYRRHNGKLLFVEDVFELELPLYYWLDYKNLSFDHLPDASKRARYLLDTYGLNDRVFFESWHAKELAEFSRHGFQSVYWIRLDHPKGSLKHHIEVHKIKALIVHSEIIAISGEYQTFLKYPTDIFKGFPVFVFTINSQSILTQFIKDPYVKVILTDKPALY